MPPFAGDGIATHEQLPLDDDATADARAEDYAEDGARAGARSVDRLGERETISVVLKAHRPRERALQVLFQRPAD